MQLSPETFEAIRAHFCKAYPNEGCGLVLKDGSFIPCENVAQNPKLHFEVADEVYHEHEDELAAVVHSHSLADPITHNQDPRMPSGADLQGHIDTAVPWGITQCDGENIENFIWLGETHLIPLLERDFLHGYLDCYAACRDWYRVERDLTIPEFARDMSWWTKDGEDLYMEGFKKAGFYVIDEADIREGDAALMSVASRGKVNHAGVIVGNNEVFHHLYGRLSCNEPLSKYATKGAVVCYLRHETLNQD